MLKTIKYLYDTDYHQWIEETVKQLEQGDYDSVDWVNLIEEVKDLGKSEKNGVKSLLTRLLEHLLKLAYWDEEKAYNQRKWRSEIVAFRLQIKEYLEESPSLKNYLETAYPKCLQGAFASMSQLFTIPEAVTITLKQALEDQWFPDTL